MMLWYQLSLIPVVLLLIYSDALSTATATHRDIKSAMHSVSAQSAVVHGTNASRALSVNKSGTPSTISTSSNDVDANDLENRMPHGWERVKASLKSLKSLKSFKSLESAPLVAGPSSLRSAKSSIESKLQQWAKNKKPLEEVKKELKMDTFSWNALDEAPNFQDYERFISLLLPIWKEEEYTPHQVKQYLGLDKLINNDLVRDSNFKYLSEFLIDQVKVWREKERSVDDVLKLLELDTVSEAVVEYASILQFYAMFLHEQVTSWIRRDVSVVEAAKKMTLSHAKHLQHMNDAYMRMFVEVKMEFWAANQIPQADIKKSLGLINKKGVESTNHPNLSLYNYFALNVGKYRQKAWLKQELTTEQVWRDTEVYRVKTTQRGQSGVYKEYEQYVDALDDHIITTNAIISPKFVSQDPHELQAKTQVWIRNWRPEEYVKESMGLKGLEGAELENAKHYNIFKYYLEAMKASENHVGTSVQRK